MWRVIVKKHKRPGYAAKPALFSLLFDNAAAAYTEARDFRNAGFVASVSKVDRNIQQSGDGNDNRIPTRRQHVAHGD